MYKVGIHEQKEGAVLQRDKGHIATSAAHERKSEVVATTHRERYFE